MKIFNETAFISAKALFIFFLTNIKTRFYNLDVNDNDEMKNILITIFILCVSVSLAQDKEAIQAAKKANNYIYEANNLASTDDFVSAEVAYRKALSKQPLAKAGAYNLGNTYYKKGNYEEALFRHQQATKAATTKEERHRAFHNMGNVLMKNENYKQAVEAYKNALRNNPTDEETRYNLALAKKKQKEQEDKNKDKNKDDDKKDDKNKEDKDDSKDKKDENKDSKNDDKKDKEDNKDKGDEDKKEEDKKEDEGKPKNEKEDNSKNGEDDNKEEKKPQQQPGQLSPQQIKSLLEAMNNQEQKVQQKMNEEKQKGVIIKTEKDW